VTGEGMMRQIEGRIGASLYLGMSGLGAHVIVRVQLMCGSEMTLTGVECVTLSVRIQNQTLWYDGVFQRFLSMLPILHGQNMYNVHKSVRTICMIFVDFTRFFWSPESTKTDELYFEQNRSSKPAKPIGLSNFGPVY
jgi:hypothetical protein